MGAPTSNTHVTKHPVRNVTMQHVPKVENKHDLLAALAGKTAGKYKELAREYVQHTCCPSVMHPL